MARHFDFWVLVSDAFLVWDSGGRALSDPKFSRKAGMQVASSNSAPLEIIQEGDARR